MLLGFFSGCWSKIEGRTLRTTGELDRAEALVNRMVRLVGLRETGTKKRVNWAEVRVRAYSLLVNKYNECRRMVSFLRWNQGDADEIAPSLHASRGRRKKDKSVATPSAAPAKQPEQQSSQPAVAERAATGANAPLVTQAESSAAQNKIAAPHLPGGSPFL